MKIPFKSVNFQPKNLSHAVISNFPWKLESPYYHKAQTRKIPSFIKPSMSVCGRAAKYVSNHLRLNAFFKKKTGKRSSQTLSRLFTKFSLHTTSKLFYQLRQIAAQFALQEYSHPPCQFLQAGLFENCILIMLKVGT